MDRGKFATRFFLLEESRLAGLVTFSMRIKSYLLSSQTHLTIYSPVNCEKIVGTFGGFKVLLLCVFGHRILSLPPNCS